MQRKIIWVQVKTRVIEVKVKELPYCVVYTSVSSQTLNHHIYMWHIKRDINIGIVTSGIRSLIIELATEDNSWLKNLQRHCRVEPSTWSVPRHEAVNIYVPWWSHNETCILQFSEVAFICLNLWCKLTMLNLKKLNTVFSIVKNLIQTWKIWKLCLHIPD